MKRSEINRAILTAKEALAKNRFYLPFFAHMKPEDWKNIDSWYRHIV